MRALSITEVNGVVIDRFETLHEDGSVEAVGNANAPRIAQASELMLYNEGLSVNNTISTTSPCVLIVLYEGGYTLLCTTHHAQPKRSEQLRVIIRGQRHSHIG